MKKTKFSITRMTRPEQNKKKTNIDNTCKDVSLLSLFKYASGFDIICISIGVLISACVGCLSQLNVILSADVTGAFIAFEIVLNSEYANNTIILKLAEENLMDRATHVLICNLCLGILVVLLSYISVLLITWPATRQMTRIRSKYMEALLNKDISWYDTHQTGDFSSRIIEDMSKIEEAIGDKLATCTFHISVFVSGVLTGMVHGCYLALICLLYLPASITAMVVVSWLSNKLVKQEIETYATAAAIAEEVIGAIRTVVAFDGQNKEIARYKGSLVTAKDNNICKGLFAGINQFCMWFFLFCSYALSFYYGIKLIIKERSLPENERVYTPENMITVFYSIFIATWNLGQCAPYYQIFSTAGSAAKKIFTIIEDPPIINKSKGSGYKPMHIHGDIAFRNVHFHYPSRPEVKILNGFSLNIQKGGTVALVGMSGCGKSTVIQLIQRFYDTLPRDNRIISQVTIDNVDIRDYDLAWLRSKIGVVGQEPILFATTIAENILLGNQEATYEDIIEAAKKANAHNFIERLPQGYNTFVGDRGTQLSGGQKQRIAIARALIRNPTILLLDEATSALDTHSEALVQEALDKASEDCTTIIVAHRLSTIRGADRIVVIQEGHVIEDGKHEDLMKKNGAYYKLVTAQITDQEEYASLEADENKEGIFKNEDHAPLATLKETKVTQSKERDYYKIGVFDLIWKILKLNRPEWLLIVFGTIFAFIQGSAMPIYSVVFGDVLGIMSDPDDDHVRSEANRYSLSFLLIGIGCGIAAFVQTYFLSISGEKLTLRVRSKMIATILNQEMSWFDVPERGLGALCTMLSADASGLQGASGQPIGTALNSLSSLGIATCIGLYYEWRTCLVCLVFAPIIFTFIYLETIVAKAIGNQHSIEGSANYAIEAISNIRTVASLGIEKTFHIKYLQLLKPHYDKVKYAAHFRGIVFGIAKSLVYFTYGTVVYYGATLIRDEHLKYATLYKVFQGMLSASWSLGMAIAFAPNFQRGIVSARKVLKLLSRESKIKDDESVTPVGTINTNINYENVYFSYPTRQEANILNGLNLRIQDGKTVALVGPSGCGKSTIIQLLERFYDPNKGYVNLADRNIKHIKLSTLRSQLGMVPQEPTLFDRTIAENIAYGDNSRDVPMEEIMVAAKNANIHNFITGLPFGYETKLGTKGIQLSGGQKQRVAIARALVRNPPVLLLDEATSALDTESEKIVQEALEKARIGRTCIMIAHRLVTIQDAEVICVINKGIVAEMGTHSQLLEQRGIYHKLYNMQMGRKKSRISIG